MRNEIKFRGSYNDFTTYLNQLSALHTYPVRNVNSIYFDTNQLDYFIDSEEGTVPRKKIRYRWYNSPDMLNTGSIEVKKTFENSRDKDNIKIENINYNKIFEMCENIVDQPLKPVVKVSYRRDYFVDKYDYRYTVDYNIEYSALDMIKQIPKIRSKSFEKFSIMEVKTPLDVDQGFLIKEFGDKRVRHSKYCEAVKNCYI